VSFPTVLVTVEQVQMVPQGCAREPFFSSLDMVLHGVVVITAILAIRVRSSEIDTAACKGGVHIELQP